MEKEFETMHLPTQTAHGGDLEALKEASGLAESDLIDASANINPLGPPDWLEAAFSEGRRSSGRYPDPSCRSLRAAASECLGVPPDSLVFGCGADELMFALARSLGSRTLLSPDPGQRPAAIVEAPSYASYREASQRAGYRVLSIPARMPPPFRAEENASPGETPPFQPDARDEDRYTRALSAAPPGSLLWMGAPNNPTGLFPAGYPALAVRLAERFPDRLLVCDEAFLDFAEGADPQGAVQAAARLPNLVVLRSMTKFWAVPGLRIGYAVLCPTGAKGLRAEQPSWPINSVAEAFARRAFQDPRLSGRRETTRLQVAAERRRAAGLFGELNDSAFPADGSRPPDARKAAVQVFESCANYYLVRSPRAAAHAEHMARRGVAVRSCANFEGLGQEYLRVAVRGAGENDRILAAFSDALRSEGRAERAASSPSKSRSPQRPARPARALMIQGCSSGAGKSLLAAAFCRIFRDEGLDVAPYKAQNMSLNSAVTPDGLELGRAQAVQAAACGLEPDVRMSPVLLKPESDRSAQVVLMGKPFARREARDYYAEHDALRNAAFAAYDSLAREHELIVLEGAGSPAEINLKSRDFVNMEAARHAGARVLLVGDIDRGGVFASFIGHVATFSPEELNLFSGFIVNKFRGDPALLGDAFRMTRERTGYPVLGCVPLLSSLDIPDEDEPVVKASGRANAELRIAVPRLRHVSNFTDLDAFACEPDVDVVPFSSGSELEKDRFDAVVIPGSKSTVQDFALLTESGMADAIRRFASRGGAVVGICGGYQMLGVRILDPEGVESDAPRTDALGLLPLVTTFSGGKTLARTRARWISTGEPIEGYEIHQGATRPEDERTVVPVIESESGAAIGYGRGSVWGSYLHGVFDSDDFRRGFLNRLRERRGLGPLPPTLKPGLDAELGRLAEAVRSSVDMDAIIRAIGL